MKPVAEVDRGEKPFITEWGVQSAPKWSPDGRKIAFVSTRTDHSFIVVYDVATRAVKYISPSVDFDTMPMWLSDSKHLMFMRRPGLPFGQQAQQGAGGIGLPNGPAFQPPAATAAKPVAAAAGGRGGNRGGGGGGQAAAAAPGGAPAGQAPVNNSPGLMRATFKGGYTLAFYKADVTTGEAQETWHNQPNDTMVTNFTNVRLAGDSIIFPFAPGGGGRGGGRGARGGAPGDTPRPPTPAPAATAPGRRVGSLLLAQHHGSVSASGAAHDRPTD